MLVNEQEARQGRKGTCPSNDIPHSTHSIPNTKLSNNCSAYEWAYTERTFVNQNIHFHTQALFTAEVNSNSACGMVSVGDSQMAAFTNTGLSVSPASGRVNRGHDSPHVPLHTHTDRDNETCFSPST